MGTDVNPLRIAVVGGGYRAGLYLDLVRRLPHLLEVTGVMVRSERAAVPIARRGLRVHRDLPALLQTSPSLVMVLVPALAAARLVVELVRRGAAVLTETPPAADMGELRTLWNEVGSAERVQVAEQYLLFPHNAARLQVVRNGLLGTPTSVQVSSTQLYHATSIIRGFLGVGARRARVLASASTAPLANPISRSGWTGDAQPHPLTTTVATFDFGDGRCGLYDFTETQTRNPLRTRRLIVRGSVGELVDDRLVRLADAATVLSSSLERRQTGHHQDVQGADIDQISVEGQVVFRNPFPGCRLSDEEIAMATLLQRVGAWSRQEAAGPYSLADAAQDQLLSSAIESAVSTGREVVTSCEAWAGSVGR
ncbi:Gfo/Idh/MocA family oxidoreductase [Kineococcus gypseus]|uniref:Gfo/Idh/MocA family oxidoreductase n=1 Tax=Kineococcus gypseus TaxID=1637102 RepID=UPI003D7C8D26